MARLTFNVCDLCVEYYENTLDYEIILEHKDEGNKQTGDICRKCYEALASKLKQEIKPTIPLAGLKSPRSDGKKSPAPLLNAIGIVSQPGQMQTGHYDSIQDTGDGISFVPSNLTDAKRREMNRQKSDVCQHSTGFTMEDDGPHCKDCGEKVKI